MKQFDLIVIGAGPGGYETAAYAAKMGKSVMLAERDELGGTCLNRGCIPTKSLCHSAHIARILKANACGDAVNYSEAISRSEKVMAQLREGVAAVLSEVDVVKGEASFIDKKIIEVNGEHYSAEKIIIATGSKPAMLQISGAELAETSDTFLSNRHLPESCVIIGGGVIGLEFATILSSFGCNVTVLEFLPEILPGIDREVAKRLRMVLKRKGIKTITYAQVTHISSDLKVSYLLKGKEASVDAEKVIMCVGRKAIIPKGLHEIGVEFERGFIKTDDKMETNIKGLFAVGDCNGKKMLAHAASAQGKIALGLINNIGVIPSAVFTDPECASVGITEAECVEKGLPYASSTAIFRSNGKALAEDEPEGLVKIIINSESRTILGAHICGAHAADLIAEIVLAMENDLTIESIARTVHSHPTLGEVVMKAAEALC